MSNPTNNLSMYELQCIIRNLTLAYNLFSKYSNDYKVDVFTNAFKIGYVSYHYGESVAKKIVDNLTSIDKTKYTFEDLNKINMNLWNSKVALNIGNEFKKYYDKKEKYNKEEFIRGLAHAIYCNMKQKKFILSPSEFKNLDNFNDMYRKTPCIGRYRVSGYTRDDGVKVKEYMRSCGAKHIAKIKTESAKIATLKGEISKIENIESEKSNKIQNELTSVENIQKSVGKFLGNEYFSFMDYYKKSLQLADGEIEEIEKDKNNKLEQVKDLEDGKLKDFIKSKIIKSRNLYPQMKNFQKIIDNSYIITPTTNSVLYKQIVNSDTMRDYILKKYNEIINGNFNKNRIDSIVFDNPKKNNIKNDNLLSDLSLYLILHNVDVFNFYIKENDDIYFEIIDDYNFELLEKKNDYFEDLYIQINNNAYYQQQAGELIPYIIRIPIIIPQEKFKNIHGGKFMLKKKYNIIKQMPNYIN